jgi:hypothetical protein
MSTVTEMDMKLLEESNQKREQFVSEMVKFKYLYLEDTSNDYYYILYLASIMNFVEAHNNGCLSECGMLSLQLDISPYIAQIQQEDGYLSQKELVRFLLNILNSYATLVLTKGMIEFSKEEQIAFFEVNPFPSSVKDDFDMLNDKVTILIPKFKQILDTYCPLLDCKYKKIFTQEKTKGFRKQIFNENAIKISGSIPRDLANARECS